MPDLPSLKDWPHPKHRDAPPPGPRRLLPYAELQVTTNFSFLRGASHPEEFIERAAALGYKAIAITDLHSLAGVVRAHIAAKEHGIKLIIGSRIPLCRELPERTLEEDALHSESLPPPSPRFLPFTLCLYVQEKQGYANLCRLLTKGKRRAPKGECWLGFDDLSEFHADLLAAAAIHDADDPELPSLLKQLKSIFDDDRLSLSIWNTYGPENTSRQQRIVELSSSLSIPLLATNDAYYHAPQRRMLQDALTCIRHGTTLDQAGFLLFANAERHLKPAAEMSRLFKKYPQAVARCCAVADRVNFSLDELRYHYPREICPDGKTPLEYLKEITWQGAREHYPHGVPQKVIDQLCHEMKLIEELRYEKYFLTVYDIVQFARERQILYQGRGAAANSAVCYCLGITAVDPDRVNLLFERFISKERNEPPDIDIDFEHERREEVIQYIYNTYGRHRAALVAEVITYRRKSAVRDIAKVFGLSLDAIDNLVRVVKRFDYDTEHPSGIPALEILSQAAQDVSTIAPSAPPSHAYCSEYLQKQKLEQLGDEQQAGSLSGDKETLAKILYLARCLVGFPRHLSQHVGGFVISETPLCEMVPIENAAMEDRTVIEWDKDDVDALGMLKIDVLGLGMLTCIRKAFDIINERAGIKMPAGQSASFSPHHASCSEVYQSLYGAPCPSCGPGSQKRPCSEVLPLMLHTVPPEDPVVYDMICRADTIGVFQVESRAQMSMLPRLKPRCYYDLVIEVAIVRPGPVQGGMVHPYLRRRAGKEKVNYPDKSIEKILGHTLGVPIFQEQAMELAVVGAGFTPGEADQLRRAMASWKRSKNVIQGFEQKLINGMIANGYSPQFARQCFDQINGFGEYGFPQSHAASFALLVYISAWLKRHHPAAFAAALLNSQPMGFYQPAQIIDDVKRHGATVKPIDVNFSSWDCTLEGKAPELRLGMRLVRGLQEKESERITNSLRDSGRFASIKQLWRRTGVSVNTLRLLARGDAFGSLGLTRQRALWDIRKLRDERLPLLELCSEENPDPELPAVPLPEQVLRDYQFTGLSLKAHPLSFLRDNLEEEGAVTTRQLKDEKECPNGRKVKTAGIVLIRQRPSTASGVVFMTIEDETGTANLVVFPQVFQKYRAALSESVFIYVEGRLQREEELVHVILERAKPLGFDYGEMASMSRDFH